MKANIAKLLLLLGGGGLAMVFDAFMTARSGSVDQTGAWWLQMLTLATGGLGGVGGGLYLGRGATAATDTKAAFAALVKELTGHPQREALLSPLRDALIADAVEDFKKANEFPPINPPAPVVNVVPMTPPSPPAPVAEVANAPKA